MPVPLRRPCTGCWLGSLSSVPPSSRAGRDRPICQSSPSFQTSSSTGHCTGAEVQTDGCPRFNHPCSSDATRARARTDARAQARAQSGATSIRTRAADAESRDPAEERTGAGGRGGEIHRQGVRRQARPVEAGDQSRSAPDRLKPGDGTSTPKPPVRGGPPTQGRTGSQTRNQTVAQVQAGVNDVVNRLASGFLQARASSHSARAVGARCTPVGSSS